MGAQRCLTCQIGRDTDFGLFWYYNLFMYLVFMRKLFIAKNYNITSKSLKKFGLKMPKLGDFSPNVLYTYEELFHALMLLYKIYHFRIIVHLGLIIFFSRAN